MPMATAPKRTVVKVTTTSNPSDWLSKECLSDELVFCTIVVKIHYTCSSSQYHRRLNRDPHRRCRACPHSRRRRGQRPWQQPQVLRAVEPAAPSAAAEQRVGYSTPTAPPQLRRLQEPMPSERVRQLQRAPAVAASTPCAPALTGLAARCRRSCGPPRRRRAQSRRADAYGRRMPGPPLAVRWMVKRPPEPSPGSLRRLAIRRRSRRSHMPKLQPPSPMRHAAGPASCTGEATAAADAAAVSAHLWRPGTAGAPADIVRVSETYKRLCQSSTIRPLSI